MRVSDSTRQEPLQSTTITSRGNPDSSHLDLSYPGYDKYGGLASARMSVQDESLTSRCSQKACLAPLTLKTTLGSSGRVDVSSLFTPRGTPLETGGFSRATHLSNSRVTLANPPSLTQDGMMGSNFKPPPHRRLPGHTTRDGQSRIRMDSSQDSTPHHLPQSRRNHILLYQNEQNRQNSTALEEDLSSQSCYQSGNQNAHYSRNLKNMCQTSIESFVSAPITSRTEFDSRSRDGMIQNSMEQQQSQLLPEQLVHPCESEGRFSSLPPGSRLSSFAPMSVEQKVSLYTSLRPSKAQEGKSAQRNESRPTTHAGPNSTPVTPGMSFQRSQVVGRDSIMSNCQAPSYSRSGIRGELSSVMDGIIRLKDTQGTAASSSSSRGVLQKHAPEGSRDKSTTLVPPLKLRAFETDDKQKTSISARDSDSLPTSFMDDRTLGRLGPQIMSTREDRRAPPITKYADRNKVVMTKISLDNQKSEYSNSSVRTTVPGDGTTSKDDPRMFTSFEVVRHRDSSTSTNPVYQGRSASGIPRGNSQAARPSFAFPLGRTLIPKETRHLKAFETIAMIGQGGYAIVRVVKHRETGFVCALKQIAKADFHNVAQLKMAFTEVDILSAGQSFVHRGRESADDHEPKSFSSGRLSDNERADLITKLVRDKGPEYFPEFYGCWQNQHFVFFLMEYLPGGDLMKHLIDKEIFSEKVAKFYTAQVAIAIGFLHDHLNYVHRDMKPDNILFDRYGHTKLVDFGLSRSLPLGKTKKQPFAESFQSAVGTPDYMAPEVHRPGLPHDRTIDWWSLGIILYEMLFGGPPLSDLQHRAEVTSQIIRNWKSFLGSWPKHPPVSSLAKDLLRRLIAEKEDRFKTVEEVLSHPWYRDLNLDRLREQRGMIIPNIGCDWDVKNFDTFSLTKLREWEENKKNKIPTREIVAAFKSVSVEQQGRTYIPSSASSSEWKIRPSTAQNCVVEASQSVAPLTSRPGPRPNGVVYPYRPILTSSSVTPHNADDPQPQSLGKIAEESLSNCGSSVTGSGLMLTNRTTPRSGSPPAAVLMDYANEHGDGIGTKDKDPPFDLLTGAGSPLASRAVRRRKPPPNLVSRPVQTCSDALKRRKAVDGESASENNSSGPSKGTITTMTRKGIQTGMKHELGQPSGVFSERETGPSCKENHKAAVASEMGACPVAHLQQQQLVKHAGSKGWQLLTVTGSQCCSTEQRQTSHKHHHHPLPNATRYPN